MLVVSVHVTKERRVDRHVRTVAFGAGGRPRSRWIRDHRRRLQHEQRVAALRGLRHYRMTVGLLKSAPPQRCANRAERALRFTTDLCATAFGSASLLPWSIPLIDDSPGVTHRDGSPLIGNTNCGALSASRQRIMRAPYTGERPRSPVFQRSGNRRSGSHRAALNTRPFIGTARHKCAAIVCRGG